MAWGGPEEQKKEQEAGNPNAKDWHDEVLKIVEKVMDEYWENRTTGDAEEPCRDTQPTVSKQPNNETLESEFNCHHCELIQQNASLDIGRWSAELRCYLSDLPADVTKNTDIMQWWAVSKFYSTHIMLSIV